MPVRTKPMDRDGANRGASRREPAGISVATVVPGMIAWPGSIAETSSSVVDNASTSAEGFIELISGSTVTPAPTPANDTAAIFR